MGYLQALNLMVRAYKAARGVMPKGLDLLKLKMKARQKVIDSKKVIEFPKDRITNPFKQRPQSKSEAEMLARMKRQNKEAVQRLKEKKKPRDDKATGGIANLSSVYDNNPTLQAQFPDKQDYLDLFSSTTTTTPQTQTYAQMTQQQPAAGIPAVKPIVPIIPQGDSGDGGGGGITKTGPNRFDYGYTTLSEDLVQGESPIGGYRTPGTEANIDFLANIGEGTIPDEDYGKKDELIDTYYGAKAGLGNFYKTVSPFLNIKRGFEKAADFSKGVADKIRKAKEAREAAAAEAAIIESIRQQYASQGRDYGQGAASAATQASYEGADGSYAGASKEDYGSGE
jgi:hypothetical protein